MDRAQADLIARRTVARYAAAIDQKDYASIAALFAADGELRRAGEVTTGGDAIAAFYEGILPTFGHMRHFITNTLAEPDGELIRVHSYFSYIQVLGEGVRFGWGDYNDMVRPTSPDDGVFVEKEIIVHHAKVVTLDVAADLLPISRPPA